MRNMTIVLTAVLAALVLGSSAQAALVLHWKLDETQGTTFKEEVSGLTNIASKQGNVQMGQTGLAPDGGNSIGVGFDTPPSYVDAGTLKADNTYVAGSDPSYKTISNQWTMATWMNADAVVGGDNTLMSSDWSSSDGWLFGLRGTQVFFDFGNERKYSGLNVTTGNDFFLAVVNDTNNIGAGDDARFYVYDGSAWQTADFSHNRPTRRLQGLEIGSFNAGTRQFDGLIDDARIYDHALTMAELEGLVTMPIPEPSALMLACLGVLGLGWFGRRRRR